MKHVDYLERMRANEEYRKADERLRVHFALGKAVVRARIGKGWSQSELARRVHTRQANISRIESGLGNPTLRLIADLTATLGIGVEFTDVIDSRRNVTVETREIELIPAPDWMVRSLWRPIGVPNQSQGTL